MERRAHRKPTTKVTLGCVIRQEEVKGGGKHPNNRGSGRELRMRKKVRPMYWGRGEGDRRMHG